MKSVYYLNFVPRSNEFTKVIRFRSTEYQAVKAFNALAFALRDSDVEFVSLERVGSDAIEELNRVDFISLRSGENA